MSDELTGKPEDTAETNVETPEMGGGDEVEEGSEAGSSSENDTKTGGDRGNLFFNPNEIPEELQPVFKRMQASFTRKMQMASFGVKKAQAYDQLVRDPRFRQWYESLSNEQASNQGDSTDEAEEQSPAERRLASLEQRLAKEDAAREFNEFKGKHPQWANYNQQLIEMLEKRPTLTYEEAFKLVAFDDATDLGSRETIGKLVNKKKANTSKPSNVSSKGIAPVGKGGFAGAYELAKKQLGL